VLIDRQGVPSVMRSVGDTAIHIAVHDRATWQVAVSHSYSPSFFRVPKNKTVALAFDVDIMTVDLAN
jgi:hypothetical protein